MSGMATVLRLGCFWGVRLFVCPFLFEPLFLLPLVYLGQSNKSGLEEKKERNHSMIEMRKVVVPKCKKEETWNLA